MALKDLDDRAAVLAAIEECDRLGQPAFLAKYGFRKARDYFLNIDGRLYDSKAIAGAAHGYQFPDIGPLKAGIFSGGAATVQRKLASMGFHFATGDTRVVESEDAPHARVSDLLSVGGIYSRKELEDILDTHDATLKTGVFHPAGFKSVLLFVTKKKTADRVQYIDNLEGDVLHWQGQKAGRTDEKIIGHRARGLELLLFYRAKKDEYEGAAFKYEGPFDYQTHNGALPANFTLMRSQVVRPDDVPKADGDAESQAETQLDASGAFDPTSIEDARKKTFSAIVMRQGQPAFRRELLAAYDRRCALTNCAVEQVLEAAHICRYMGRETNDVRNGLLLRADVHTLYDRSLIAIEPITHRVFIAPPLKGSDYEALAGCSLRLPKETRHQPSVAALANHWALVRSIWEK